MTCRARAELRHLPYNASYEQREKAHKSMIMAFNIAVSKEDIIKDYKESLYYETKRQKRRRKKKEAVLARIKNKE